MKLSIVDLGIVAPGRIDRPRAMLAVNITVGEDREDVQR